MSKESHSTGNVDNHEFNVDAQDSEQVQAADLRVSTTSKIATQPIVDHVDRVMQDMDSVAEDYQFGEPTLVNQSQIDDIAKNMATIDHVPKINRLGSVFSEAISGNKAFSTRDDETDLSFMFIKIVNGISRKGINQAVKHTAKNKAMCAEILEVFEVLGDDKVTIDQDSQKQQIDSILSSLESVEPEVKKILDTVDDSQLDREFKNLYEQIDTDVEIGHLKLLAFKNLMDVCSNPLANSLYKKFMLDQKDQKMLAIWKDNFDLYESSENAFFSIEQNYGFRMADFVTQGLYSLTDKDMQDKIALSLFSAETIKSRFERKIIDVFMKYSSSRVSMLRSQEEKDFKNDLTAAVELMSEVILIEHNLGYVKKSKDTADSILKEKMSNKHGASFSEAVKLLDLSLTTLHDEQLREILNQEEDEDRKLIELRELAAIEQALIKKASEFRQFIASRGYNGSADEMSILTDMLNKNMISQQLDAILRQKAAIEYRQEQLRLRQEEQEAKSRRAARIAILREQTASLFDAYYEIDNKYNISGWELRNNLPEFDELSDAFYSALFIKKRNHRETAHSLEERRKTRELLKVILGAKAEHVSTSDYASQVFKDSLALKELRQQTDEMSQGNLVPSKECLLTQLRYLDKLIDKGNAERVIEEALNGNDILLPVAEFIADYIRLKEEHQNQDS